MRNGGAATLYDDRVELVGPAEPADLTLRADRRLLEAWPKWTGHDIEVRTTIARGDAQRASIDLGEHR